MPEWTLPNLPFDGRFPAKLEALLLADLGARLPEGPGDALLIYDVTVPYLYLPNVDADDWIKFALIDVTGGEPDDDDVLTWDASANSASFQPPAGGSSVTYGVMHHGGSGDVVVPGDGFKQVGWATIVLDTANVFDYDGIYTNNLFTAPATGVYQHSINLRMGADATGRQVIMRLADVVGNILGEVQAIIGTPEINLILTCTCEIAITTQVQVYLSVNAGTLTTVGSTAHGEWAVVRLS